MNMAEEKSKNLPKRNSHDGRCYWMKPEVQEELQPLFDQCIQNEEEMWQIMQIAADTAVEHFSSWEEYGRSFIMGRGVWHGDPDDSETAYDIVSLLLENEESPWKQQHWSK